MPYTPPAQQSPGASNPSSPPLSRSHSYLSSQMQSPQSPSANGRLSTLPRSTSSSAYLSKHRRSPSASKLPPAALSVEQPSAKSREAAATAAITNEPSKLDPHGSIRQSPPPENHLLIPVGAILSPPETSQNSSDDDETIRGRGRKLENLAELQAAIRTIEQRKEGSPGRTNNDARKVRMTPDLVISGAADLLQRNNNVSDHQRPPLSKEARRISHSRSSTDSSIVLDVAHQIQPPLAGQCRRPESDEEDEDSDEMGGRVKPPMVRKKSGELVRPALRVASTNRRPSSMPGTPTYSKAVHFDSHLEHVKHFLQVDKPLAVSAGSSPVEAYEGEIEFPFSNEESGRSRGSYECEIQLSNFPAETEERKHLPVRVERVFLSSDRKSLIGVVVVQNLAFQKHVTARFTLDYWKTTSEVVADYNSDIRRKQANDGCDRFNFAIKLTDQANLESKTMFFCVRYDVDGRQYWDNNGSINYQVEFVKKPRIRGMNDMPGLGARPLHALPRSRPSPPMSAGGGRPRSMTQSFDDFASGFDSYGSFNLSPTAVMGDSPLRLKGPRSRAEIVPDAPTRRSKANGQAFGSRYDFGASLSAAIQNASTILGDQSGFTKGSDPEHSGEVPGSKPKSANTAQRKPPGVVAEQSTGETATDASVNVLAPTKPAALVSEKPSLQSQSYQELVDKYCFFGSAKSSPRLNQPKPGPVDSMDDDSVPISAATVGSGGSFSPTEAAPSPAVSEEALSPSTSPQLSPSSPTVKISSSFGSRTASPVSFGYPYHQPLHPGFFDTYPATAIQG